MAVAIIGHYWAIINPFWPLIAPGWSGYSHYFESLRSEVQALYLIPTPENWPFNWQDVEWGFCFDVHLNAFFPILVILHFIQLFVYHTLIGRLSSNYIQHFFCIIRKDLVCSNSQVNIFFAVSWHPIQYQFIPSWVHIPPPPHFVLNLIGMGVLQPV